MRISIVLFIALLQSCNLFKDRYEPLIAKDLTDVNEKYNTLFAFVGEKISIDTMPYEEGSMDEGFIATYKIMERVYGRYEADTIRFDVYDHYGTPGFSRFEHALLFVSKREDGSYYHEKYQYFDVYKTKDGRWGGPYNPYNWSRDTTIKPVPISFLNKVTYPRPRNRHIRHDSYPSPCYSFEGQVAVAHYGNYLQDLFSIKKNGVLGARGLFTIKEKPLPVVDVPMAVLGSEEAIKYDTLRETWKPFYKALQHQDRAALTNLCFDSLWVFDSVISKEAFVKDYVFRLFDKNFIFEMEKRGLAYKEWSEPDTIELLATAKLELWQQHKKRDAFTLTTSGQKKFGWKDIILHFMRTKKGFLLYSCETSAEDNSCLLMPK